MKVRELVGEELDYWVAKALGWIDYPEDSVEQGSFWHIDPQKAPFGLRLRKTNFKPSTDWVEGGPLIESMLIAVEPMFATQTYWRATSEQGLFCDGETVLIAAMRLIVYVKFGEEV